jgi:YidC/Oxa1 family membrane protein insertase
MNRFYRSLAILIIGLSMTCLVGETQPIERSRLFDTSLYKTEVSAAGNLTAFVVKSFDDPLVKSSFNQKGQTVAKKGGLLVGPIGRMSVDAKMATSTTSSGASVELDPTGTWLPAGVQVERKYRFANGSYTFEVDVNLTNATEKTVPLSSTMGETVIWLGPVLPVAGYATHEIIGLRDASTIETLKLSEEPQTTAPGLKWIGARDNHYCAVFQEKTNRGNYVYQTIQWLDEKEKEVHGVILGFRYQYPELRAYERASLSFRVYLGPKVETDLGEAGYGPMFNNWDGFTGGIGKLMFHTLQLFYKLTGSYGIAILLLTLLVKVLLHPLNLKQLRSMAKLQEIQPKLQDVQKRYTDKKEQQEAMQRLYLEHNVNPLGGCFPILIQIPIFIALYSCLMGAVELKKVRFLWMPDLAMPDPIALLPILFAGSIYLSSKMTANTQQVDKTQQSVMQIMPILMLVLMVNVPAGVMLYLAGQSILSIFETRMNQKLMEAEKASVVEQPGKKKKKDKKPSEDNEEKPA